MPLIMAIEEVSKYILPEDNLLIEWNGVQRKKCDVSEEAYTEEGYTAPEYNYVLERMAKRGHTLSEIQYGNCLLWGTFRDNGREKLNMSGVRQNILLGMAYLLRAGIKGDDSAIEILSYYCPEQEVLSVVKATEQSSVENLLQKACQ